MPPQDERVDDAGAAVDQPPPPDPGQRPPEVPAADVAPADTAPAVVAPAVVAPAVVAPASPSDALPAPEQPDRAPEPTARPGDHTADVVPGAGAGTTAVGQGDPAAEPAAVETPRDEVGAPDVVAAAPHTDEPGTGPDAGTDDQPAGEPSGNAADEPAVDEPAVDEPVAVEGDEQPPTEVSGADPSRPGPPAPWATDPHGPVDPVAPWTDPYAPPPGLAVPPAAPPTSSPGGSPGPAAAAPVRRPRPGPAAPVAPAAAVEPARVVEPARFVELPRVVEPARVESAGPVPPAAPAARPASPSPRPRPGPPAGAPRPGTSPRRAAPSGRRGARSRAARPARRRRLWPVLLAAVLAVAVLGAVAFVLLDRRTDAGAAATAEQVPEAVLPDLTEPAPALAELSADAPAPSPAVLAGVLTPLLADPALGTGVTAQVVDVATGDVLFDQAGAEPGTPASTTKLLTGLATLTSLDPESTIGTSVVAGAAPGEVVLVGGGDPTLSTTAPSVAYPGAATVADLAAQVQAQLAGVPVTRVVVDGSLFDGPLTAPGWGPDDAPSSYAAPVTAAAVDGARVDPDDLQRSGQPGTDAGTALAAALGAPAAEVVLGTAPAGARTLGAVESASVQRLVEQSLTQSDNLLSESLARHVALARGLPATFAGSAQAVSDAVAEAGLDTTGLSLVDASGLSGQDRAPARLLVDVLRAVSDGTLPEAAGLPAGLPVAGYTGTLADRTADGAGPGAVRAKTGTLLAVHDLAGTVLTADGRLLAFAVLADAAAGGPVASETALDGVAAALAGCGCR